jgi:ATP-dependent DNA helicase DinG
MLVLLGDPLKIKELVLLRKQKYNYKSTSIIKRITNTKITHFIGGGGEEEEQKLKDDDAANNDNEIERHDSIAEFSSKKIDSKDLEAQAILDIGTLTAKIDAMLSNPKNWIVYNIKKDDNFDDISSVEFKMLDVSEYCKSIFDRCYKTLIMSATILNPTAYCRTVGLNYEDVKVIQVPSSFPVQNRPIHSLNIAYLNLNNLQLPEIKSRITKTIDDIMTIHRNHKGIIHTTSYEQLNFIKENISENNAKRLVETNPNIERDEVIAHHVISNSYNNNNNNSPTVLISPSLYTGIDLKDDLSRFQIIVKVPYPNLNDKWIAAKMQKDKEWYYWQTALRLVQAYGRSVRSKEDWAKTYILDSAFTCFIKKNGNILPDWFKQAVKLS